MSLASGTGTGTSGTAPGDGLSGGRMSWAEAVSGPLSGFTCLWQDLDGLHVEPAPLEAPPTSVLWGWRGESLLARVRLDGGTAYVAVLDVTASSAGRLVRTVPWRPDDGRVAAARAAPASGRAPTPEAGGVGAAYEQVVIGGIDAGPVTFVRPAGDA